MALDKKYYPTDLRRVLAYGDQEKYILKNNALVFSPVKDTENDDFYDLESINTALSNYLNQDKLSEDIKALIFPVEEIRLNRRHWVALHYDIESKTATLIDSRPGYMSFWYPKGAMKQALRDNEFEVSRFNTIHQGVQHDDTHSGAWTAANILALTEDNVPVEKLAQRFTTIWLGLISLTIKKELISHLKLLLNNGTKASLLYW